MRTNDIAPPPRPPASSTRSFRARAIGSSSSPWTKPASGSGSSLFYRTARDRIRYASHCPRPMRRLSKDRPRRCPAHPASIQFAARPVVIDTRSCLDRGWGPRHVVQSRSIRHSASSRAREMSFSIGALMRHLTRMFGFDCTTPRTNAPRATPRAGSASVVARASPTSCAARRAANLTSAPSATRLAPPRSIELAFGHRCHALISREIATRFDIAVTSAPIKHVVACMPNVNPRREMSDRGAIAVVQCVIAPSIGAHDSRAAQPQVVTPLPTLLVVVAAGRALVASPVATVAIQNIALARGYRRSIRSTSCSA